MKNWYAMMQIEKPNPDYMGPSGIVIAFPHKCMRDVFIEGTPGTHVLTAARARRYIKPEHRRDSRSWNVWRLDND